MDGKATFIDSPLDIVKENGTQKENKQARKLPPHKT